MQQPSLSPCHVRLSFCTAVNILLIFTFIICDLTYGIHFTDPRQASFVADLDQYEIQIPSRVNRAGKHISHTLYPHREKRSVKDVLHYKVKINSNDVLMKLEHNKRFISPALVIEKRTNAYKNVTDSVFKRIEDNSCHYTGHVVGDSSSKVALEICNGLRGLVHTSDAAYFIEPVLGHTDTSSGHPHLVYKSSSLPLKFQNTPHHYTQEKGTSSCDAKDNQDEIHRDRWEQHQQSKRSTRKRRSISVEHNVEAMVVVDPLMMDYYKNEDVTNYVLTIMNMVVSIFHDASLGNAINIVLVRLVLLEADQDDLEITHHADKSLRSFCKWQATMNFKDDEHPNHHDIAILLTRKDICSRMNEPCSTLGLSMMSGMCQPHRSCNINEDTGLALAITVAHELGHNFGMKHDGIHNDCELRDDAEHLYVMSAHLLSATPLMKWSACSRDEITKFVDRGWGYCLNDAPADLGEESFNFPVLPPGTMYDADHQCRLVYGPGATLCDGMKQEDICNTLWCRVNNRCSTRLEAAAEGTICGKDKWCFNGKCVEIGERPQAINGNWGEWSSWSECTRTCDAGVSIVERHCDNPQPSNGGKFCIGERRRHRICNTDPCPEDVPTFRQVQCEEFNYIPYKNALYEWDSVPTPNTPCQLHCKPKDKFFSVMLRDTVVDGTPCTPGTKNMCISGKCTHVGCDYVINSNAKEDHCGVCRGDGSTCETIKDQYNETQGLGYVEATVIPKNARNILVEEVAEANNYLALQNDKGEYYLNGNWFIQWSGDYEIAGTTITYLRHRNKDMFKAAGPLKEPLHIMLLLQGRNPGVRFEYTVPKENATDQRPPEFSWQYQDWTHCTASCGGGTQRSAVVCVEKEAGIVDNIYCTGNTSNPDDKQRVCNDHLCPARWWAGPWQHCSVTCGNDGIHRRTVICVRSLGQDEQIALEDTMCEGQEKHSAVEPCRDKAPCPGTSEWITSEWSSCVDNVCGIKTRSVTCKDLSIGCDSFTMPDTYAKCSNITCGYWETEDWGSCTRECDGGVRFRKVNCIGSKFCDLDLIPPNEEPCNTHKCPTTTTVTTTTTTTVTYATTSVVASSSVPIATDMEMSQTDLYKVQEFLPDFNYKPESLTDRGKVGNMLMENESVLKTNEPGILTNKKHESDQYEEVNLGNGKIVEIHEGGLQNGNERDMNGIISEIHISSNENLITLEPESSTNDTDVQYHANVTENEAGHVENVFDSENNDSYSKGSVISNVDSFAAIVKSVKEFGYGQDSHITEGNETNTKKQAVFDKSNGELIISIKEGGSEKNSTETLAIPQIKDEVPPVEIEDQSQTGNDNHRHIHQGFNEIDKVQSKEDRVDIKKIGPGRIPEGMGRPLPKFEDVNQFLDRVHFPYKKNGESQSGYKWIVYDWTECTRMCGYGVQTREVTCVNGTSGEVTVEEHCNILTKPTAIQSCIKEKCSDWKTSVWSQCSSTCGFAVQRRAVTCADKHHCDPDHKPEDVQSCKVPACLAWIHGQWSKCSQTCNGGQQIRLVECVNMTSQRLAVGCPELLKPAESQDCHAELCPNQDSELKTHSCDGNVMSHKVCHALQRMGHCNKMFVKVKCCKTCEETKWRQNRPTGDVER